MSSITKLLTRKLLIRNTRRCLTWDIYCNSIIQFVTVRQFETRNKFPLKYQMKTLSHFMVDLTVVTETTTPSICVRIKYFYPILLIGDLSNTLTKF